MRLALTAFGLWLLSMSAAATESRLFEFSYVVSIDEIATDQTVDIFIPLPAEHEGQKVLHEQLNSSLPGTIGIETVYGNRYYRITRPANSVEPIEVEFSWVIQRDTLEAGPRQQYSEHKLDQFLQANDKVPVGHEILDPILAEIHAQRADDSKAATARAIYDWVVDNVEYKKVGTGWGNGDTFWACNERYGNCTDFHALFISLARSEGIPARFDIGFPVPGDRQAGIIGGYHCWVEFYLPGKGWVPIDASEAAKHPDKRELFYGTQPADRIHFTTGRDLLLTDAQLAPALNYFIYPYVEVAGRAVEAKVNTRFAFRNIAEN